MINHMYITRFFLSFFLFFLTPFHVYAEATFSITPGIMYFHYEEFDLNNNTLDTESGFIPGVSLSIHLDQSSLGAHLFTGKVDYDGQTQSGVPHKTDTDESLYYFFYRYDFLNINNDYNFFVSTNYQFWERLIKANNGVGSLYEEYSWWHVEAGFKINKTLSNHNVLKFELASLRTFNGDITIDLNDVGFGEANLDLGDKFGLRGLLSLDLNTDYHSNINIGIEYKYWGFGRSNTEILSDGLSNISITEPESDSNLLRFFIQFTQSF